MGKFPIHFAVSVGLSLFACSVHALAQIGVIDSPQFQDVVAGSLKLGGWAMDSTAPLTKVENLVDGTDFGPAPYGGNRADACLVIGNYPGCPRVGWTTLLNTLGIPDGPHMLRVVLTTLDQRQSAIIQPFIVDNARQGLTAITYYRIVSRATGGVSDIPAANPASGTSIQEWQYSGGANQLWNINPTDDGAFTFESLSSSKVLTVPFSQTANGTIVQQIEDAGFPEQEWRMVSAGAGSYALLNIYTGRALELQGGSPANGTPIQIYDYFGYPNQLWLFVPVLNPPFGLFKSGGREGRRAAP